MSRSELYSSLQDKMTKIVCLLCNEHPSLNKLTTLKTLGAKSWDEIFQHMMGLTQMSLSNHGVTWIILPPITGEMKFEHDSELLSAVHYLNWTWDYTERFKKFLANPFIGMMNSCVKAASGEFKKRDWGLDL